MKHRKLCQIMVKLGLRNKGISGDYCPKNNLHLTMAFIGEKFDLQTVVETVDEIKFQKFEIETDFVGSFKTSKGVIWAGLKKSPEIEMLAKILRQKFDQNQIPYSKTPFYPHISLLRNPNIILENLPLIKSKCMIEKLSVMKSERINNQLIYTEIFSKKA